MKRYKEFSNGRSKQIFEEAKAIAKSMPFRQYIQLDEFDLEGNPSLQPRDACRHAEWKLANVLTNDVRDDGRLVHRGIQEVVAVIRPVRVTGLKTWITRAPKETRALALIKNPHKRDEIESHVGKRSALVVWNNIAFIARMLRPNRICVVRPVLHTNQDRLIGLFSEKLSKLKKLK